MNMRQSAGSWFQLASVTSALTSLSSEGARPDFTASRSSEIAIAGVVMGFFAQARHSAADPIGGPVDELDQWHARIAEQPRRLGRVDEPCFGRFAPDEERLLSQALPEAFGQPAHADGLGTADIERTRGHRAMAKGPQHHG